MFYTLCVILLFYCVILLFYQAIAAGGGLTEPQSEKSKLVYITCVCTLVTCVEIIMSS